MLVGDEEVEEGEGGGGCVRRMEMFGLEMRGRSARDARRGCKTSAEGFEERFLLRVVVRSAVVKVDS